MDTVEQNIEKAFKEGLHDDTIRPDPSNSSDPKTSVTNQDKKITNEDEQKILTEETDDHGTEIMDDNNELAIKPDTNDTAFLIELTEEEKRKNKFQK